jgi:hypothetical protein
MSASFLEGMSAVLIEYASDVGVSKEGLDHQSLELTGRDVTFWLAVAVDVGRAVLDEPTGEQLVNFGTPYVLGLLAGAAAMRAANEESSDASSPGAP